MSSADDTVALLPARRNSVPIAIARRYQVDNCLYFDYLSALGSQARASWKRVYPKFRNNNGDPLAQVPLYELELSVG
jgi:hypothetical protein